MIITYNVFPEQILDEEQAERQLAKMEQQLSKTERKLQGTQSAQRSWFQTRKQREDEKARLAITSPEENQKADTNEKKGAGKRKRSEYGGEGEDGPPIKELNAKKKKEEPKKKSPEQLAKERVIKEIEKASLVRAKMSKLKKRPGKLSTVADEKARRHVSDYNKLKPTKRRGQSAFTNDLTDVSRSGALRLRYEFYSSD